jgi:peptide/nickel transport system substrate-binding protein
MDERNELFREATVMIIRESVRVFVVTTLDPQPMSANMRGVTEDRGAGIRSMYNLREMYVPGKPNLEAGHLHVYTSRTVWGPVDARNFDFFDVYSVDPWTAIHDPWLWNHPHSGEVIPFRVSYTVDTAGPDGNMSVPEDAFMWNTTTKSWADVGPGVAVKSKVTFDLSNLLGTHWHDGQTITWADVLFDIYLFYEWTYADDKIAVDPIWNAYFSDSLALLKGFRIIDDTHLEVYVDYWHFDPNEIAAFAAPPVTSFPWELNFAAEQLVLDGTYAWNRYVSGDLGVPQLNFVLPGHAADLAAKMQELRDGGVFPENVFTVGANVYGTLNDANARYDSAIAWINDKGHAVISNGPFYLESFDPAGDSLVMKAFEDATYPFPPGTWVFGTFLRPNIVNYFAPSVNLGTEGTIIVDISQLAVDYEVNLNFFISDPTTGEVLLSGSGEKVSDYRYTITIPADFTTQVGPGTYQVDLLLYSPEMALLDYRTIFFSVLGTGVLGQEIEDLRNNLNQLSNSLQQVSGTLADAIDTLSNSLTSAIGGVSDELTTVKSDISTVSGDVSSLSGDLSGLSDRVSKLEGAVGQLNTLLMATVVIVIINLIAAIALFFKK